MALQWLHQQAKSVSRQLGLSEDLALLERAWQAEIGGLACWARIVAIERGSLVVEVDSSPAMQELSLRRRELIRRVNNHFPSPLIRHLTIQMANHG